GAFGVAGVWPKCANSMTFGPRIAAAACIRLTSTCFAGPPDITAIAKGLGAGYQPIGAMLCTSQIYDTLRDGSGFFQHGHTYIGHPAACAAGKAVVERLLDDNVLGQVAPLGRMLKDALTAQFGQHPYIGDIRGRGLFLGLELVQDRETRAPFDPAQKVHARIKSAAFGHGLICYPMGGTVDGKRGDHVLLAPPFTLTEGQVDELTTKLAAAIESALSPEMAAQ
ncbi:MAG: aminotransferase class III-fold pyridoxal phosphate-dependent enzyme, partial [Pseudomonadota bacterium]